MDCNYNLLTPASIQSLAPYIPGKTIEQVAIEQGITDIIKLASNENPLGCSPLVHHALSHLSKQTVSLYPNSVSHAFRHQLAHFLQIDSEQLVLSNGSDAIYGLLLTLFALQTDKHVLTHQYAFSTYEIQAKTLGIPIVITPTRGWEVDIDAIINTCNEKTALIFLANPNNPTGLLIKHAEIERLLANIPSTAILVLDEAYYEFASDVYQADSLGLLSKYSNLIITRTFSKVYGLAGLRLGYGIANPEIIALLYKIQLPFAVNIAAMTAASAAIKDQDFIHQTLEVNRQGIQQMQIGLDRLNIPHLPTTTNFITIDCQTDGGPIFQRLQQHGIIVRPLHPYGMANYLRVTIGLEEQNKRFLLALAEVLNRKEKL